MNAFVRTEMLLGTDAMKVLAGSRVAVFGIGGVGGHACEALARCGVGTLDLIDADTVEESNINRQIVADYETIGRFKTEVMEEKIRRINPEARVFRYDVFFDAAHASDMPFEKWDYVVDAIDTVTAKLDLICLCRERNIPVISSMGAGNKLDPTAFRIADIYETRVCPLAKVMRRELKKRGIDHLKVVYSEEEPLTPAVEAPETAGRVKKRSIPGSIAFVPSVAGLVLVSAVVRDLTGA